MILRARPRQLGSLSVVLLFGAVDASAQRPCSLLAGDTFQCHKACAPIVDSAWPATTFDCDNQVEYQRWRRFCDRERSSAACHAACSTALNGCLSEQELRTRELIEATAALDRELELAQQELERAVETAKKELPKTIVLEGNCDPAKNLPQCQAQCTEKNDGRVCLLVGHHMQRASARAERGLWDAAQQLPYVERSLETARLNAGWARIGLEWYRRSCEFGHPRGCWAVARALFVQLRTDVGDAENDRAYVHARAVAEAACEGGDPDGCCVRGIAESDPGGWYKGTEGTTFFARACNLGSYEGCWLAIGSRQLDVPTAMARYRQLVDAACDGLHDPYACADRATRIPEFNGDHAGLCDRGHLASCSAIGRR